MTLYRTYVQIPGNTEKLEMQVGLTFKDAEELCKSWNDCRTIEEAEQGITLEMEIQG